jgi:DNA-binding MarR family transcriptional regulator
VLIVSITDDQQAGKVASMVVEEHGESTRRRPDAPSERLGYLLKHAQQRFSEISTEALRPYGVTGRQCAILATIAGQDSLAQQDVARILDVDRTTMVALIDDLEGAGLVVRRTHPDDRRKNLVELTPLGKDTLRSSEIARRKAEQQFLSSLSGPEAAQFRNALRALVHTAPLAEYAVRHERRS